MLKNLKGCYSHKSDDWRTPSILYDTFISKGYIDPCPFMSDVDNLHKVYNGSRVKLFINPPYSQLDKWCDFILNNLKTCMCICLLIPVRTDTKYFKKLFPFITDIYFIEGRLHFNDSKLSAPFPSMLCCFGFMSKDSHSHVHLVTLNKLCDLIDCWGWCIGHTEPYIY